MLRRREYRLLGFVAALGVAVSLMSAAPALADGGGSGGCSGDILNPTCSVGVGDPGTGGGGSGGGSTAPAPGGDDGSPAGFTPGPQKCSYNDKDIPCQTGDGWWSSNGNCTGYVKLSDPQPAPEPGESAAAGAWYTCTCPGADAGSGRDCYGGTFWSNTPPAGINTYTPAQAAAALVKTFQLEGIDIGMAPANKTHTDDPAGTAAYRRTWVGIPVWLWVENPQPLTYGPYSKTATLGGVTVTATATVSGVTWSSGDGQTVNCGAGTAFNEAAMGNQVATDSPTCGFRYTHTSKGGTFPVTATSHWTVNWTGGGTDGTIAVRDTQSATTVHVGELQSVNTVPDGGTYG